MRNIILILCVLMIMAGSLYAAFESRGIGGRAIGLANAYVAVADDATAPYHNPAGLATILRTEFMFAYYNQFNLASLSSYYVSYVKPLYKLGVLAGSYYRFGQVRPYNEEVTGLSWGIGIMGTDALRFRIGTGLKYCKITYADGDALDIYNGLGVDFGGLAVYYVKDINTLVKFGTDIKYRQVPGLTKDGFTTMIIKPGISATYNNQAMLSAAYDLDSKTVSTGVEWRPFKNKIAVRGGYHRAGGEESAGTFYSIGGGFNLLSWELHYAYQFGADIPGSSAFEMSTHF